MKRPKTQMEIDLGVAEGHAAPELVVAVQVPSTSLLRRVQCPAIPSGVCLYVEEEPPEKPCMHPGRDAHPPWPGAGAQPPTPSRPAGVIQFP